MRSPRRTALIIITLLLNVLSCYPAEYATVHFGRRSDWQLALPTDIQTGIKLTNPSSSIEIMGIVCDGKLIQPEETEGLTNEEPVLFPSGAGCIYSLNAARFMLRKWVDGKAVKNKFLRYSLDSNSKVVEVSYRVHYWEDKQAKISDVNKVTSYEWHELRERQKKELERSQ